MPDIADSRLEIIEATSPLELEIARTLFVEYAADLSWDLSAGGRLAAEIENIPGPYAPPRGSLMLAMVDCVGAGVLGLQAVPEDARVPGIGAESFAELKRLFVRPGFRRLGVARALLRQAEREAGRRGYTSLVLTTSANLMPLAQSLYDSLSYAPMEPYRTDMTYPDLRWLRLDI